MMNGSRVLEGFVPNIDATVVTRLLDAGATIVGKTNSEDCSFSAGGHTCTYGPVRNPRKPTCSPGGSSNGSAVALAAGDIELAIGVDQGGSIRIPAACCGIVGFKPTYGLVSLDGCFPLAPSFDHAGPMARDVATCEEALGALVSSFEPLALESLDEIEVGVAWVGDADPLVRARVEAAAAHFSHRREIELPAPEGVGRLFMREVAGVHQELFAENSDLYGEDLRIKIERCLDVTDAEAETAAQGRAEYRETVESALAGIALIVTPTLPCVAPRVGAGGTGDIGVRETLISRTFPFNALGWPALALPCGPAEDGLPASVQLAGRPGSDALVLAAGRLLEAALAR